MPFPACPNDGELSDYCLGNLPAEQLEAVADHLDLCPACSTRLIRLSQTPDSLADAVRHVGHVSAFQTEMAAPTPTALREYQLLDVLGEGGMGTVYRALHTRLGRPVALKLLTARRRLDPDAGARFEREMRAIGALRHPNIVHATDAGEVDGVPFLVMELLDGRDLAHIVNARGPLPVADACEIVRQAALGLQHAHEHGLVHRDVKPSNLMLTPDGTIKLLDLGLARSVGLGSEALSGGHTVAGTGDLTDFNTRVGTENYMSPEQRTAPEHVTMRADLYALGRTMVFLLTGDPNKPLTGVVPAGVARIAQQLQAERQDERYDSAASVAAALMPWCSEHDLPSLLGHARRPPRQRTVAMFAVPAVVAVALAVGVGLYFASAGNTPGEQAPLPAPAAAGKEPPQPGRLGMSADAAEQLQREWAEHAGVEVHTANRSGIKLTLIPPGEFNLSVNAQARITRPYYIGTTEVTRGQFRKFVDALNYRTEVERKGSGAFYYKIPRPNDPKAMISRAKKDANYSWQNPGYAGATDEYPVTMISWHDAVDFCEWLSSVEGRTYRLPTQAEQQWAARAGESWRYPSGRAENESFVRLEEFAWTFVNSRDRPQPVGGRLPNRWGLFDVLGNADEMSHDWRGDAPAGLHIDYQGPATGTHRMLYGGGYNNRATYDVTFAILPDQGTSEAGFRVVCEPLVEK